MIVYMFIFGVLTNVLMNLKQVLSECCEMFRLVHNMLVVIL